MVTQYDSDEWCSGQVRLIQQRFVSAFQPQLDELPINDPRCAFLISRGVYSRGTEHGKTGTRGEFQDVVHFLIDEASRSAGGMLIGQDKGRHSFNRAVLGGPEGLFSSEDLGVDRENFAEMLAEYERPEGISQKALDNSKKLIELAENVEDAVKSNDLDAGFLLVFGRQWLDFKASHKRDDDWGQDND